MPSQKRTLSKATITSEDENDSLFEEDEGGWPSPKRAKREPLKEESPEKELPKKEWPKKESPKKESPKKESKAKERAAEAGIGAQVNQDGDTYAALGKNRRVTVRKFNGKPLIDIREFYVDKEENLKPGKKGISLNPEQWEALKQCLPAIDEALANL